MIKKMKILKCLNSNTFETEKDSFKIINHFTSRIKRAKSNINNLQLNDNYSFSGKQNQKQKLNLRNINNISTYDDFLETLRNSKESFRTCNNDKSNKDFFKDNKKIIQKRYLKQSNNYNNIILNKKNILLNIKSCNNNINIFPNKDRCSTHINKIKKDCSLFSFDATFLNKDEDDNKIHLPNCENNQINELDYKFEIIQYKKQIESLKKRKQEKMNKIKEIKILNSKICENKGKIKIKNINSKQIDDIILLLKKNYNSNTYIKNNTFSENILLSVMDLKYTFEKSQLVNLFFEGLYKILKISNYTDYNGILKKFIELIDSKNDLINMKNKYNNSLKEKEKYFNYISSLLTKFQISEISELYNFVKNMNIKNIRESNTFEKIKVNLMKDLVKKKPKFLSKNENHKTSNSEHKKIIDIQNYFRCSKSTSNFHGLKNRVNSYKQENKLNSNKSYNIKYKNNNSSKYVIVSNGKDKIIKVNKKKKKENIQKNLFDKIKNIKINKFNDLDRNNISGNLWLSFPYK